MTLEALWPSQDNCSGIRSTQCVLLLLTPTEAGLQLTAVRSLASGTVQGFPVYQPSRQALQK